MLRREIYKHGYTAWLGEILVRHERRGLYILSYYYIRFEVLSIDFFAHELSQEPDRGPTRPPHRKRTAHYVTIKINERFLVLRS